MSNYNTFQESIFRKSRPDQDDHQHPPAPPPLLYASPVVSSALITAFGRPTLIEYDAPSSAIAPEFTPIRDQTKHVRTHSLPATAAEDAQRHAARTALSRSSHDAEHISAYTYRLRTFDHEDRHHLVMCQNPDGTYSHANADGEPLPTHDLHDDLDSVVSASALKDVRGSVTRTAPAHRR
jgi:hypothetical protein